MEKSLENNLRRFDTYLILRSHKLIILGMLTLIFSYGNRTFSDVVISLSWASIIEWSYISCRKYGWLDTMVFIGVLPFLFIGATVSALTKSSPSSNKPDFQAFATEVSDVLVRSINERYDGKIIDTRITNDAIYITVETPYGLRVPVKKILATVAHKLHISASHIEYDDISARRSYYTVGKAAIDQYEAYKGDVRPIESFSEIKQRLFCTSKKGISQT